MFADGAELGRGAGDECHAELRLVVEKVLIY